MDQNLGASITLSFALVAVFAIVLYQPEQTPLPRAGPEVTARKPEAPVPVPREPAPAPVPALTPVEPLTIAPAAPAIKSDAGRTKPAVTAEPRVDRAAAVAPRSSVRVAARRSVPAPVPPPTEGFTRASEGETLRDVAIRVYGSSDETEALWRLNRDLIKRKDGALPGGTLLRTP